MFEIYHVAYLMEMHLNFEEVILYLLKYKWSGYLGSWKLYLEMIPKNEHETLASVIDSCTKNSPNLYLIQ